MLLTGLNLIGDVLIFAALLFVAAQIRRVADVLYKPTLEREAEAPHRQPAEIRVLRSGIPSL
jgi:hypothetical protein